MNRPSSLLDQLALGQSNLKATFGSAPRRTLKAGELLGAAGSNQGLYHVRMGWACQFHDFTDGRRSIREVYLPGDVIGLNAVLGTRPVEKIFTLTAVTMEVIPVEHAVLKLMSDHPTALYIAWLLSKRQQRTAQFLTAISHFDARGRLAAMLLDLYTQLRRRKLISGSTYNLPLTQAEIGNYLGLTVVHINRILRSLRAEQIVVLEKHCVTILDLERLTALTQDGEVEQSHQASRGRRLHRTETDKARCIEGEMIAANESGSGQAKSNACTPASFSLRDACLIERPTTASTCG